MTLVFKLLPFKKSPFAAIRLDREISFVTHGLTISGCFGGGKSVNLYRFQGSLGIDEYQNILQSHTIAFGQHMIGLS